ncbi:MAG: hypothetical protein ACRCU6_03720 [Fusobacteriaceae bacterium]
MKKIVIVGFLLIGALSLGNTQQPTPLSRDGKILTKNMRMHKGKKSMNKNLENSLTPEQKIAIEKNKIAIQEKRLEVKKSLLDKNPDWKKIEKLNLESAVLHSKNRTEMQKLKFEFSKAN